MQYEFEVSLPLLVNVMNDRDSSLLAALVRLAALPK